MQFDAASPTNYLESRRFHNLILSTQPENLISIHFKVLTGAPYYTFNDNWEHARYHSCRAHCLAIYICSVLVKCQEGRKKKIAVNLCDKFLSYEIARRVYTVGSRAYDFIVCIISYVISHTQSKTE